MEQIERLYKRALKDIKAEEKLFSLLFERFCYFSGLVIEEEEETTIIVNKILGELRRIYKKKKIINFTSWIYREYRREFKEYLKQNIDRLYETAISGNNYAKEFLFEILTEILLPHATARKIRGVDPEDFVQITVLALLNSVAFKSGKIQSITAYSKVMLDNIINDLIRQMTRLPLEDIEEYKKGIMDNYSGNHANHVIQEKELEELIVAAIREIKKRNLIYGYIIELFYSGYQGQEAMEEIRDLCKSIYKEILRLRKQGKKFKEIQQYLIKDYGYIPLRTIKQIFKSGGKISDNIIHQWIFRARKELENYLKYFGY